MTFLRTLDSTSLSVFRFDTLYIFSNYFVYDTSALDQAMMELGKQQDQLQIPSPCIVKTI
jgi:hypothetical protein